MTVQTSDDGIDARTRRRNRRSDERAKPAACDGPEIPSRHMSPVGFWPSSTFVLPRQSVSSAVRDENMVSNTLLQSPARDGDDAFPRLDRGLEPGLDGFLDGVHFVLVSIIQCFDYLEPGGGTKRSYEGGPDLGLTPIE